MTILDAGAGHPNAKTTERGVKEALVLLREHSGAHLRWLRRSVNQIVLANAMHAPAAFDWFSRTVFLSVDAGAQFDAAAIAAMIAHEATHARLSESGVGSSRATKAMRTRIERRCVREQLTVLERIDPQHAFVAWSRQLLETSDDTRLLPTEIDRRAIVQRAYRRVRLEGLPRWVGRVVVRIALLLGRR